MDQALIAVLTKRIIWSCLCSSLVMFGISYTWHGVFLNDIASLDYPLGIYLIASSLVYLVLGMGLVKLFSTAYCVRNFHNLFARGLLCGASSGLMLYMVALVLGVTFTKKITLSSMMMDIPWQIFEQAVGGIVIAVVYSLIFEPLPFRPSEHNT